MAEPISAALTCFALLLTPGTQQGRGAQTIVITGYDSLAIAARAKADVLQHNDEARRDEDERYHASGAYAQDQARAAEDQKRRETECQKHGASSLTCMGSVSVFNQIGTSYMPVWAEAEVIPAPARDCDRTR